MVSCFWQSEIKKKCMQINPEFLLWYHENFLAQYHLTFMYRTLKTCWTLKKFLFLCLERKIYGKKELCQNICQISKDRMLDRMSEYICQLVGITWRKYFVFLKLSCCLHCNLYTFACLAASFQLHPMVVGLMTCSSSILPAAFSWRHSI